MTKYLISYDLIGDKDYEKLFEAIKSLANGYSRPLESVWIIGHKGAASDIVNALSRYIDNDDKLFVTLVTKDTSWTKTLTDSTRNWLKKYIWS
ncbi:hypothetical protein [Acinetobacter sp. KS-LM10]|uniref:hypothetical protein n=1 Tax=Acinetobacter sp. KS-LM10 TaxID=3120518 RepID=UPI0030D58F57